MVAGSIPARPTIPLPRPKSVWFWHNTRTMRRERLHVEDAPEVVVSTTETSMDLSRACKAGRLRRLSRRLYTWNQTDEAEQIVHRNLWNIVAGYFPGGLIADRTALETAAADDGSVCLISGKGDTVQLPGHLLRPRRGVMPLPSDLAFRNGLWMCSLERAYLENLRPTRVTRDQHVRRTLGKQGMQSRLDSLVRHATKDQLDQFRRRLDACAFELNMPKEGAHLAVMIALAQKRARRPEVSSEDRKRRAVARRKIGQIPISFMYNQRSGKVPQRKRKQR